MWALKTDGIEFLILDFRQQHHCANFRIPKTSTGLKPLPRPPCLKIYKPTVTFFSLYCGCPYHVWFTEMCGL